MQGALAGTSYLWCCVGLIPACAGNTEFWTCALTAAWAHPRSRGEHAGLDSGNDHVKGSSPLARGTLRPIARDTRAVRLIPARAGNTSFSVVMVCRIRAHPRSRGEHYQFVTTPPTNSGSSPLARGTPDAAAGASDPAGLIPARAGNTYSIKKSRTTSGAHPRSRGEHCEGVEGSKSPKGSSPLARGTRRGEPRRPQRKGLIPARAGNTSFSVVMVCRIRAHPRSRGEHPNGDLKEVAEAGSSPLARGTLHRQKIPRPMDGLIPARAGNTEVVGGEGHGVRAHPRSRGEHSPMRTS